MVLEDGVPAEQTRGSQSLDNDSSKESERPNAHTRRTGTAQHTAAHMGAPLLQHDLAPVGACLCCNKLLHVANRVVLAAPQHTAQHSTQVGDRGAREWWWYARTCT